jgi:hypothetical protein
MKHILIVATLFVPGSATILFAQTGSTPSTTSVATKTYCVSCHSGRAAAGRVSLDTLDIDHPAGESETWERVVRQLRARTMPPMTAPRPDNATYESMIAAIASGLDRAAPGVASLDDSALGKRVARLIWNGEPDRALSAAASKGELQNSTLLQAQIQRLLADPKSIALVNGFFVPWLSLDSVRTMEGDSRLFPDFDSELRQALLRETTLFIQSQLRENGHAADLWTANYTFLNERLARHYGIANVTGPDYRRVTWPTLERAGLLGQGSVLTLTSRPFVSYPIDVPTTSPAERAKWMLTRFLGVTPPATVQGVPPEDFPFDKHMPLAKQSRTFPATPCLACHRSFFPLSYGLENFDVLGRWRADYGRDPIDATGMMVDGTTFDGPVELRQALLARQDAFLNSLTERLMAYALDGTTAAIPTPASRMPRVRAALRQSAANNYSWSSLIAAIAKVSSDQP